MFELIIKDIMEVAGYLPIGILCGCIAVVVYLVSVSYTHLTLPTKLEV